MVGPLVTEPAGRSDADLARRVLASPGAAGPEEAELCRRFAPRVRLFGLRHLRDEEAAGELTQRVLLLLLEKLRAGEVTAPERVASFVLGVARRTALAMRRDGARLAPLEPDALPAEAAAPPDPLLAARLAGCLEALGERERSVVVLTFYQGQGAAEIAAALALSEGNVRVVRHRGVGRLRACLEGAA
ncbi:MAG: sigma-70 family RNA polymerase sigma factor [Planctomycetes bacterium]|nr:sigma-70 family RNA polymerase sigma factor [Planctomycetota bacterium]